MKEALEAVEVAALMGATFSFALLIEWAVLQGFFRVITVGLRPVAKTAPVGEARKPRP